MVITSKVAQSDPKIILKLPLQWLIFNRMGPDKRHSSFRKFLGNGTFDRDASSLVTLGKRVFAIGGFRGTEVVEEFNYNEETW